MRISDWSSDVCSSDLRRVLADPLRTAESLEDLARDVRGAHRPAPIERDIGCRGDAEVTRFGHGAHGIGQEGERAWKSEREPETATHGTNGMCAQIGRAHALTTATNAPLVWRLLLEETNPEEPTPEQQSTISNT